MIKPLVASVHIALADAVGSSESRRAISQSRWGDCGALTRSGAVAMVGLVVEPVNVRTNGVLRLREQNYVIRRRDRPRGASRD
jgi:hypothetical protein